MWETCRDRIVHRGHPVLLQHAVDQLDMADGRVTAIHARTPNGHKTFEADHVISTMPIRSLMLAISPAVPDRNRQAAEGLRYRDFLVVVLILKKVDVFPDNWIYIHTPGVQVGRIQNFNNWSSAMVPVAGMTCLGMEYFCFEGDGLWESKDEDLIAQGAAEFEALGLGSRSDVVDGTVIRMPKAYPIYDAAYKSHVAAVREFIDPISNLHTVGRNGMHQYNNQDHSMLAAMLTVANMQGASHDPWNNNTGFEYHEEQRLETSSPRSAGGV